MKLVSFKVEEKQDQLLDQISKSTRVPKSALIRKGIDLVLHEYKEGFISPTFRSEVESLLSEDREILKKLAR